MNEIVKTQSSSQNNCGNCGKFLINEKCIFCDDKHYKIRETPVFCINPICKKELKKNVNKCSFCGTEIKNKEMIISELKKKSKKCLYCNYENYVESDNCLSCGKSLKFLDNYITNNSEIQEKNSENNRKCHKCNKIHSEYTNCYKDINIYCQCLIPKASNSQYCMTCIKPLKYENVKISKCITCKGEINQSLSNLQCIECLSKNYRSRSQIPIKDKTRDNKDLSYYQKTYCSICRKETNKGLETCENCKRNIELNKKNNNTLISTQKMQENTYKIPLNIQNKNNINLPNSSLIQNTPKNSKIDTNNNASFRKQTQINLSNNLKNNSIILTKHVDEKKLGYSNTIKIEKTKYLESPGINKPSANTYINNKSSSNSKSIYNKAGSRFASENPRKYY